MAMFRMYFYILLTTGKQCQECNTHGNDELLLFCDICDRGYHTFCLNPPLKLIPKDEWICSKCPLQVTRQISSISTPSVSRTIKPAVSVVTTRSTRKSPLVSRIKSLIQTSIAFPPASASAPSKIVKLKDRRKSAPPNSHPQPIQKIRLIRTPSDAPKPPKSAPLAFQFNITLSDADADTSICMTTLKDKDVFDDSRNKSITIISTHAIDECNPCIPQIEFGRYTIDTWYTAPYPDEYNQLYKLFVCEYCLGYMKTPFVLQRHQLKCKARHPPGNEVYRDGKISMFEVDGRKNKMYCQNVCFLAKMFLDHKTLFYDTEPFLFYILTESDSEGFHFVGYFSKEKRSSTNYNLSCIVTLPIYQRKGYGNFLIDFSYLLSKTESKKGTPEKPLSDLGLLSYRRYWRFKVIEALSQWKEQTVTIYELSNLTSMTIEDVTDTMQLLGIYSENSGGDYSIKINKKEIDAYLLKEKKKDFPRATSDNLHWSPFPFKRLLQEQYMLVSSAEMSE